jgi:predicted nucleic acid-binding protein
VYNSARVEERLKELLHAADSFEVVPATEIAARHYGEIKALLVKKVIPSLKTIYG